MLSMLAGVPFLVAAVSVESPWLCVVLLMGARLFNDSALAGYMSLPTELSPRHLGAIWGCMSTFGSLGGMAATMLSGFVVTATGNWALPFYTGAAAILIAALVMAIGVSAQPLFLDQVARLQTVRPEPPSTSLRAGSGSAQDRPVGG
jgi:MFS family permease